MRDFDGQLLAVVVVVLRQRYPLQLLRILLFASSVTLARVERDVHCNVCPCQRICSKAIRKDMLHGKSQEYVAHGMANRISNIPSRKLHVVHASTGCIVLNIPKMPTREMWHATVNMNGCCPHVMSLPYTLVSYMRVQERPGLRTAHCVHTHTSLQNEWLMKGPDSYEYSMS